MFSFDLTFSVGFSLIYYFNSFELGKEESVFKILVNSCLLALLLIYCLMPLISFDTEVFADFSVLLLSVICFWSNFSFNYNLFISINGWKPFKFSF